MTAAGGPRPALIASVRGLAATTVALASNRLSLLGVELAEEQARLLGLVLYGVAAVLGLGAGLMFFAVLITVLLWDNNRLLALGVFSALFSGAGTVCALVARSLAQRQSRLFEASLAELGKDQSALRDAT